MSKAKNDILLKKSRKKKENLIALLTYRVVSERLALMLSKTKITPNQISFLSILMSGFGGLSFSFGEWKNLLLGFLFLQITMLLDHVDGNLARITGKSNNFGAWVDSISNKLHRFFLLLGAAIGVYNITKNPLYLILGSIAIFNWNFSGYISETKERFMFKESTSIFKESKKKFMPVSLLMLNALGFAALINRMDIGLWFISLAGFVWIRQIYIVRKQWLKERH